eukprot:scaffold1533_cov254-Pinguiococcus_pyrenoidosus.AAC.3
MPRSYCDRSTVLGRLFGLNLYCPRCATWAATPQADAPSKRSARTTGSRRNFDVPTPTTNAATGGEQERSSLRAVSSIQ